MKEHSDSSCSSADNLRTFMLATASSAPDKTAVLELAANGKLNAVSYRQLDQLADKYALTLRDLGFDVGDRVLIESVTSAAAIAALLACCSLGLVYIPVSPGTPQARLLSIISSARPAVMLRAGDASGEDLPADVGIARIRPDCLEVDRPPVARHRHRRTVVGTDPAYIIFTSGTTGRPKGVVMSHRANIAFYRGMQALDVVVPDDRVAIAAPFHFDLCLGGIGLTLSRGATVVPVPRSRLDWPRRFLAFLSETKATQVQGVPSIWRMVLRQEAESLARLSHLRRILFSGEDFPMEELRQLQRVLPGRRLMNCYGATESMACSVTDVPEPIPDSLPRLSIGSAHPGAEMMIFDESLRPVEEPGVVGEIYLRSPALFSGYWDDPAATSTVLVRDPLSPESGQTVLRTGDLAYRGAEGELYFCGRADSQVQVRGNRVELGEVERRLREYPGISDAVTMLSRRGGTEAELMAFVVLRPGCQSVRPADLRAFCAKALPEYMAPRHIAIVDEFPVTENGKVDRKALASRPAVPAV